MSWYTPRPPPRRSWLGYFKQLAICGMQAWSFEARRAAAATWGSKRQTGPNSRWTPHCPHGGGTPREKAELGSNSSSSLSSSGSLSVHWETIPGHEQKGPVVTTVLLGDLQNSDPIFPHFTRPRFNPRPCTVKTVSTDSSNRTLVGTLSPKPLKEPSERNNN